MLRGAAPAFWQDTLQLLRRLDLSAIEEQLPPGQDSFFKAVEISFRALAPGMQDRYKALAVLSKDMWAPLVILQCLWNVSELEARRIGKLLVDRSLAQRGPAEGDIHLHDLQTDYVCALYPDRDALELIHKAIRLSSHVILRDPAQFPSQVIGRLQWYAGISAIDRLTSEIADGAPLPWLLTARPSLQPPGTSLIRTLAGHSEPITIVAVSADRRQAISGSLDGTIKMWDLESGRELRNLEGHSGAVMGLAMDADGRSALSGSSDTTIKFWDLESGREVQTLAGHSGGVNSVALRADCQLAANRSSTFSEIRA